MYDRLFGVQITPSKVPTEIRDQMLIINQGLIESLIHFQKSGAVPKKPYQRAMVALLRAKSKKEAIVVARAWSNFADGMISEMVWSIVDSAREAGRKSFARKLSKRLQWISNIRTEINIPIPLEENPIWILSLHVIEGVASLEQAKLDVLCDENLLLINDLSIDKLNVKILEKIRSESVTEREHAYILAELNWTVSNWLESMPNQGNSASALGESIVALGAPTIEMFDCAVTMFEIASELYEKLGSLESSAKVLLKTALLLIDSPFGYNKKNYGKAFSLLEISRNSLISCGNKELIGVNLAISGMAYLKTKNNDTSENARKAILLLQDAQELITAHGDSAQWNNIEDQIRDANLVLSQREPKVFISYSHRDKDFANWLVNKLEENRISVWIDERKIGVGDSISGKIFGEGISKSDFLIIVLSKSSVRSEWVRREFEAALKIDVEQVEYPFILPLLIEECEIPLDFQDINYANFQSNPTKAIEDVIEQIQSWQLVVLKN